MPTGARFVVAVRDSLERVVRRFGRGLGHGQQVFALDTADVNTRPAQRENDIDECGRANVVGRFGEGGEGNGSTTEDHEFIGVLLWHYHSF